MTDANLILTVVLSLIAVAVAFGRVAVWAMRYVLIQEGVIRPASKGEAAWVNGQPNLPASLEYMDKRLQQLETYHK